MKGGRTNSFLVPFVHCAPAFALVHLALLGMLEESQMSIEQVDVFVGGQEGYHTFRIPAVIVTRSGVVLAFCEGRRNSASDTGDIDLLLKRSFDGGRTWGPLQLVAEDGPNTVGNPCPVIDRNTGVVWLPLTHNLGEDSLNEILDQSSKGTRRVWLTKSADDGATWAEPLDITDQVKAPNWTWYATGPGIGIQLRSGRLLVPCDHIIAETREQRSHVILSDDGGQSWRIGGSAGPWMDECQLVELTDGSLLLNMRNYDKAHPNRRAIARSVDGGLTWSELTYDATLIEPICQASLLRYDASCILFSNPASTQREKMTVRASFDEGLTWPAKLVLHPGPAAYSCLTVLPDGMVGCLYECGEAHPYERLRFARFPIEALAPEG